MMNFINSVKSLPLSSKKALGLGSIFALFIALPLFVWAISTQRFDLSKKASTEPSICVAINNMITVTPETDTVGTCHDIQTAIDAVTGDGFTVFITPGNYNPPATIHVSDKIHITITGDPQSGTNGTVLTFVPNGWGFLVDSSSGSISWLSIQGGSANGMISIGTSSNFSLGYLKVDSQTSHTIDVQSSDNVSIYSSEITSSAGALQIQNSTNTNISNNVIHNSSNGISIYNSTGTNIIGNLIYNNRDTALYVDGISDSIIDHNTIINNAQTSINPAVSLNGNLTLFNFKNNIVADNRNQGISFVGDVFTRTFDHNDIWNNPAGNYSGFDDYTGINANISVDPLINTSQGADFCLAANSPAIYGDLDNYEYMGYIGPCGSIPEPTPTSAPTDSPTVTPSPIPTDSPTTAPTETPLATPTDVPGSTSSPAPLPGDVNGDGHVNIIDIGILIDNYGASPLINPEADLNSDGIVNIVDIGIIVDNYEL